MDETIWIVDVCVPGTGWKTTRIFLESQRPEMLALIDEEHFQKNTVTTNSIHGKAVAPLRDFFQREILMKLKDKL